MEAGHDVLLLRNVMPKKSSDPVVLDYAAANRLLLITCNRDDFIPLARS
jgi:predicted nuclease of predicted toxin-antitoxin system